MPNELAVRKTSIMERIEYLAPIVHRTRNFRTSSEEQAAMIMLKGHELGLELMQSLEFITPILGKVELIPRGALALVYMSGELDSIKFELTRDDEGNPFSFIVDGKRGVISHREEFTMDDARRAELVKPGSGWTKYPANMLKWRAIGFWIDTVFPDTQGGMKRADEFGAWVNDKGDVIDAEIEKPLSVDSLINKYDVEKVMNAIAFMFHGQMPKTQDDLELLERTIQEGIKSSTDDIEEIIEVETSEA